MTNYVGLEVFDSTNGADVVVDASGTNVTPMITVAPSDTVLFQQPTGTTLASGTAVSIYSGEYGVTGTLITTVHANTSGTWSTSIVLTSGVRYYVVVGSTTSDGIRVSITAQNVKYEVYYTTPTTIVSNIISLNFSRNVHPRDDSGQMKIAGIPQFTIGGATLYGVQAARELLVFRVGGDGTKILKFRGMTTNVTYEMTENGIITTVDFAGMWYMLEIRLLKLDGMAPPPFPPNTNPYLIYLNPFLQLTFGQLLILIVAIGFQNSYATGNMCPIAPDMMDIETSPLYSTIVNDQMILQNQSIANVVDRLMTSALYGATTTSGETTSAFVAEVKLNIDPKGDGSGTGIPLLSCKSFDPLNSLGQGSSYGVGQNKTGIPIPVLYLGLQNTDPTAQPVDNINLIEGANIVSWNLLYDYISMANSWVLSGSSFMGADVVALPIENPQSIAQYGVKQISAAIGNVVDPDEIRRYIGSYKAFYERPIPTIQIVPEWIYADSHTVDAGDFISIQSPTLTNNGHGGVLVDNNGNLISGTTAFVSRVKTVNYTWDAENGESINYMMMFPIQANPNFLANPFSFTAPQYMYGSARPTAETVLGKQASALQSATYNTDANAPIVSNPITLSFTVNDTYYVSGGNNVVIPAYSVQPLVIQPLLMKQEGSETAMMYGFWLTITSSDTSVTSAHVRILQPDGLMVYDDILPTNQQINILTMLSETTNSGNSLVNTMGGTYIVILSNSSSDMIMSKAPTGFESVASNVTYTAQVIFTYLPNPSNMNIKSSKTDIPNSAVTITAVQQSGLLQTPQAH